MSAPPSPNADVQPYRFEPEENPGNEDRSEDEAAMEVQEVVPKADDFCSCGHCQDMPTAAECICCKDHDIQYRLEDRGQTFACITDHPGVDELMAEAPMEMVWSSYKFHHPNVMPENHPNHRNRLIAYRAMVFWCWEGLRKKDRRPLPACLVAKIRAKFPPTENEEVFADWAFQGFSYVNYEDE